MSLETANLESLGLALPEYAKDIKLNLASVLSTEGSPDLSETQIWSIALASAYSIKNASLLQAIQQATEERLQENERTGAKLAATMMAMNNVYYRSLHIMSDKSYSNLPAKLRMTSIGNPGVDKIDFELSCFAVSAINGCGMCLDAHAQTLIKAGISQLGIQSALRLASVLNAAAMGLDTIS